MTDKPYCTIELTEDDAQLFLWFQKYHELWGRLRWLKCQTVLLNIDSAGDIMNAQVLREPQKQVIFKIDI